MDPLKIDPQKSEFFQGKPLGVFRQEAHDDFLAFKNRQDGNAKRKFILGRFNFESPILGKPMLVELEIRHDLYARDNTRSNLLR